MSERLILRNGAVLRCSGDPTERPVSGDVLIEGNRIAAVASGGLDVAETDARIIDLAGATVMPGLGDAHVHISWPLDFVFDHPGVAAADPAQHAYDVAAVVGTFLHSGYTTIIGAGVLQSDDDLLADRAIRQGLVPGPRLVPSAEMITAKGYLGDDEGTMQVAADPAGMREIVKAQCDRGARALKLFVSGDGIVPEYPSEMLFMSDAMVEAATDEARTHGAIITAHARGAESVAQAARCGVTIVHHACFLDDAAVSALEARRDDVWVCPGLHYLYAMVNGHADPWGMTPERIDESGYRTELAAQVEGIQKLVASGVRIVSGGDFGHQWTMHGTYAAEIERYVDLVGMSPIEAIHTGTRNFGPLVHDFVDGDVGEIRKGALADLFVLDGDPTAEIAVLNRPDARRMVIKDGVVAWVNPQRIP